MKEVDDDLNLAGYLMKPVQRLQRYVILLNDVLHCCDAKDPRGKEISVSEISFLFIRKTFIRKSA